MVGLEAVVAVVTVVGVVTVVAWVVVSVSGQQTPIKLPWMMQMLLRKVKKLKNCGMTQW